VARAFDVGHLLALGAGAHVVDRGHVEEAADAAAQPVHVGVGQPQPGPAQVARHRVQALGGLRVARAQRLEAAPSDASRTSTWTLPPRSSSLPTRKRPMKPVPPVTK
jgi:hypothetical protein